MWLGMWCTGELDRSLIILMHHIKSPVGRLECHSTFKVGVGAWCGFWGVGGGGLAGAVSVG